MKAMFRHMLEPMFRHILGDENKSQLFCCSLEDPMGAMTHLTRRPSSSKTENLSVAQPGAEGSAGDVTMFNDV